MRTFALFVGNCLLRGERGGRASILSSYSLDWTNFLTCVQNVGFSFMSFSNCFSVKLFISSTTSSRVSSVNRLFAAWEKSSILAGELSSLLGRLELPGDMLTCLDERETGLFDLPYRENDLEENCFSGSSRSFVLVLLSLLCGEGTELICICSTRQSLPLGFERGFVMLLGSPMHLGDCKIMFDNIHINESVCAVMMLLAFSKCLFFLYFRLNAVIRNDGV